MIKYSLICDKDHEFEGWFGSSEEFDTQAKRGLVECPICGSIKVQKSLMAPGVAGTKKSKDMTTEGARGASAMMPQLPPEMVKQLRDIKQHIEANSENVGDKFPEEARKIHYGESEERSIYGRASFEEAANLAEEGVNVIPVPDLPEDKN